MHIHCTENFYSNFRFLPCKIIPATSLQKDSFGAGDDSNFDSILILDGRQVPQILSESLKSQKSFDNAFDEVVSCFKCPTFNCRVIYSPVGEIGDFDDVRCYAEAAKKAICRSIKAGSKRPLLILPSNSLFEYADIVSLLAALEQLYVPIQYREDVPEKSKRMMGLGVYMEEASTKMNKMLQIVQAFETGRYISRDIGGGDPERMAPPRVANYVEKAFYNSSVITYKCIDDAKVFEKEYPLFQAVNRAAGSVKRHQGRIIFLEYKPPSAAKKTVILVGKGVTYDTGGADIKAGGVMAGMSRDKCGAAAVAGFMKTVEQLKPNDVHVIGVLCMVRNSVGEECYVADEMITSRAGVRIRVGNTDAEGRMCMADAVCQVIKNIWNLGAILTKF